MADKVLKWQKCCQQNIQQSDASYSGLPLAWHVSSRFSPSLIGPEGNSTTIFTSGLSVGEKSKAHHRLVPLGCMKLYTALASFNAYWIVLSHLSRFF